MQSNLIKTEISIKLLRIRICLLMKWFSACHKPHIKWNRASYERIKNRNVKMFTVNLPEGSPNFLFDIIQLLMAWPKNHR